MNVLRGLLFLVVSISTCAVSACAHADTPEEVVVGGKVPPQRVVAKRDNATVSAAEYVVGGRTAEKGAWPFAVALARKSGSTTYKQYCGGTLISAKVVLTAAHCPVEVGHYALVGRLDLSSQEGAALRVVRVSRHENYSAKTNENDIAIVELGRSASSGSALGTIRDRLPELKAGESLTAIGWGAVSETSTGAIQLRQVDVPLVPNDACQKLYGDAETIAGSMMCAGKENKDACQGDSGGPLVVTKDKKTYLVGITSFGIGCGRAGYPGVYTRVGNYAAWFARYLQHDQ
jgi:secreted trypsin-like serine protease